MLFQIDSSDWCTVDTVEAASACVSQVKIPGKHNVLTDVHSLAFPLQSGDVVQWKLQISDPDSETPSGADADDDDEAFDYIASGVVYRAESDSRCIEFSSGGLLSRVHLPMCDSRQLEMFLGRTTTFHLRLRM